MALPRLYDPIVSRLQPRMESGNFGPHGPQGITVHYTADRQVQRVCDALTARALGYHLIIDNFGAVYQFVPFDRRVSHAGKALWNDLSPNRAHLAVAVTSWGYLTDDLKAWNGEAVVSSDAAHRPGNLSTHMRWWDKATPAQERALLAFMHWAMDHGIAPQDICGHDECALPRGRKEDPGGVLSQPMSKIRKLLSN